MQSINGRIKGVDCQTGWIICILLPRAELADYFQSCVWTDKNEGYKRRLVDRDNTYINSPWRMDGDLGGGFELAYLDVDLSN